MIRNNKVYLSIVDSFYDGNRGRTIHKTHSSYRTGEKLKEELGIDDPIAYLQSEVKRLNEERNEQKLIQQIGNKEISEVSPIVYAGHFFLKAILNKLGIEPIMNVFDATTNYNFKLYDLLSCLIFARCISTCSNSKTFTDVFPHLEGNHNFSYDQLLEGIGWFGERYESIVEIFTKYTHKKYGLNTNDHLNYYYEIDTDINTSLSLLLDANQIPIGMKLYPVNRSEKPVIREIIKELKEKNGIEKRIVQVADKGLNCAQNIYEALHNQDGYIFSKSCKQLPETEKTWVLLENDESRFEVIHHQYIFSPYFNIVSLNSDYIFITKLDEAEKRLIDTTLPIKTISKSIGFDDELYFSRIFHKKKGASPIQYREMYKQK